MKSPKRALSLSLTVLAVIALTTATSAASTPVDDLEAARLAFEAEYPSRDFDRQIQYQKNFRSQFDFLDSDDQTISEAIVSAGRNESMSRWGLLLSDAEYAELDRRVTVQRELPSLAAAAVGDDWSEELVEGLAPEKSFGAFAGRWIDQMDGGRLIVALVPSHPDYQVARQRVQGVADSLVVAGKLASSDVEIRDVTFTADNLHKVNQSFGEQFLAPGAKDEPLMSASMNPVANRVDLYSSPEWVDVATRFAAEYPKGLVNVIVRPEAELKGRDHGASYLPGQDWGAGNWHAGAKIGIKNGLGQTPAVCGWGATARTSTFVYVITAAHCLGYGNGTGQVSWWNQDVGASTRRGVRTWGGGDTIADANGTGFVLVYHGSRGDLARLSITHPNNANDYECYLENYTICGQRISRRETTTETEIGDVKCMSYTNTEIFECGTINSNDAVWVGYDFLRQVNLGASDQTGPGDSGGGWFEASLMTGIHKGDKAAPNYDAVFTHAYYVETSGYLGTTGGICGTSGICNN